MSNTIKTIVLSVITSIIVLTLAISFGLVGGDQATQSLGGSMRFPNSDLSAKTITSTGVLTGNSDFFVDTSGNDFKVLANGSMGVGTSSPSGSYDFNFAGTGTTTVALFTTSTTKGSCFQLAKNGTFYRLFISADETGLTLEAGTCE